MTTYLAHHGIKGQKWGVRRFQNADGSLTEAGKQRYDTGEAKQRKKLSSDQKKAIVKTVGYTMAAASFAALAIYYKKNPQELMKNKAIAKAAMAAIGAKVPKPIKKVHSDFKKGISKGLEKGPMKIGEVLAAGAIINIGKQTMDHMFGKERSEAMFKANDKEKIAKFWPKKDFLKVFSDEKEKEDDD